MEQRINKNVVKIIIAIAIIVLVIGVVGGTFLFKNSIHSMGTELEYMYLNKLKEEIEKEFHLEYDTDSMNIQLIYLKENSDPIMVLEDKLQGDVMLFIYRQEEDEKGDKKIVIRYFDTGYVKKDNSNHVRYLYNISAKESRWYLLKRTDTGDVRCKDLEKYFDRIDKGMNPLDELEKIDGTCDYYFKQEDLKPRTVNGQEVGISKWEEQFIVPDENLVNQLHPSLTITYDMKENSKVEDAMQEYILKYNPNNEKMEQKIKESIETQLAQLENRKSKTEVAREEMKSQEESKKQAEEESRRQEESKKQEEEESRKQAEEESRKQAEEESKRQAEEEARKQVTPEEAVSIWENFIQSQEYENFTKKFESSITSNVGEKEYVIADVNADSIPELLIQFIEPRPSNEFCNTWLFVLDNRDIKLSYESYGYGRYVYSSKYNAIQVTPVNRTYPQSFYFDFFVLQGSEFTFLFGTGKDEGTPYYYSETEERRNISEEELSEYLADRKGFDWQKL